MSDAPTEQTGTPSLAARLLDQYAISLAIVFIELVFNVSTSGFLWPAPLIILPFSLGFGQLIQLLCSLIPNPKAYRLTRFAVMAVAGILFGVEYFVYRQFKMFYDPVTVTAGAGDVAGQFTGEALAMVLSPSGLVRVALFLLPAAIYGVLGVEGQKDSAPQTDNGQRRRYALEALAGYLGALALVFCMHQGDLYTTRYSFQNAVPNFGLLTSLRKEVQGMIVGESSFDLNDGTTEEPVEAAEEAAPEEEQEETPEPVVLDIDFEQRASETDNATWAELDRYVASRTPSNTNQYTGLFEGYNLIFISAEAFTKEAIRPDVTPTLYKMWKHGIQLTDYYQFDTAGTTGGECANLFGLMATEGGSSVRGTVDHNNYLTMGNLLNQLGYDGWAFHNNSYTYYGRDTSHNNLGYNHGYMGYGNGMEQWVQWQWPQSDVEMITGTFDNLYGSSSPFNVYYMSVSGHSNYDPWDNAMSEKNWDVVKDLPYSDRVKGYLAANVELDRAMEQLLARLKKQHIYRKTVIVISADHFPYGLDDDAPIGQLPYLSELFGYEVTDIFQRDHNAPIIWCGSLPKQGIRIQVNEPTMSIDLLPTLCNLFGLEWDSRLLPGRDVLDPQTTGLAFNLNYDWRTSLGTYWAGSGSFVAAEGATIPDGYVDTMNAEVSNKIAYCHGVLTSDYYRHLFGDPEDVQVVHDQAVKEREAEAAKEEDQ